MVFTVYMCVTYAEKKIRKLWQYRITPGRQCDKTADKQGPQNQTA